MLNLLIDLAIGALVGWIASMIMGSKSTPVRNIVVGILGAFVGGLIMHFLGFSATTRWAQFVVALGGACLVIWLDKKFLQ